AVVCVYYFAGVPGWEGVPWTADPAACKADLVINSNVLEHVGFPRRLVEEILQATPSGGMVFLEVPCESPLGLARKLRRLAQVGGMAFTRPTLAASVARTASFHMMHEPINYFTERPLSNLIT